MASQMAERLSYPVRKGYEAVLGLLHAHNVNPELIELAELAMDAFYAEGLVQGHTDAIEVQSKVIIDTVAALRAEVEKL